jgi:ABC-type nitrate/sulfonate/bicarbonate transport system ATPase subunit
VMSPRPGTIREIVDIGAPRPRDVTQAEAIHYVQRLRALI